MNIWWVLQFSAAASVVAAVILGLKLLFHDKLDARWHYLIWLVLLVRMLVPLQLDLIRTPVSLFETIPVLVWLRVGELMVHEAGYDSVADMLFWIYLTGAAVFLTSDLAGYLILRLRIAFAKEWGAAAVKRGAIQKASADTCRRVEEIAQKHGLKSCQRICVQNTKTPYVCGLFRTALVLTEGMARRLEVCDAGTRNGAGGFDPDEAVIVHELLHRKYRDVLVNFLLHLVRAFNWFNPFLWFVTGVVQNDSEALCDQRVLEILEQNPEEKGGYEKEYGMLLIHMAEGKERNPAKAGTSNMANSFRNMKTRIRRIADFKKVPSGIGFITLCITLMLSISGIGYCQGEGKLDISPIRSEKGLKYAMLNAGLFEPQSPVEALYLYLAAIRCGNPVYMMAVMPEDMEQEYGVWVKEHYKWDEGSIAFRDQDGQRDESGYFPRHTYAFTGFEVYNLHMVNENLAHAAVLAHCGKDEAVLWNLALSCEDGWKVLCKEERAVDLQDFEKPPLLQLTGQGEYFRVEKDCWNEGRFDDLNVGHGFSWNGTGSGVSCENGYSQAQQFPQEFSVENKMDSDYLVYMGDEDLSGRMVGVVILEKGAKKEEYADYFRAVERGIGSGGSPLNGSYCNMEGSAFMDRERVRIGDSGVGPAEWEGTEKPVYHVWIYVDRELAEEFDITVS